MVETKSFFAFALKAIIDILKVDVKILLKQTNVHLLDGKNISFTRAFPAFYC